MHARYGKNRTQAIQVFMSIDLKNPISGLF